VTREAGLQRVRDSALGLARVYVGMSVAEALLLWLLGLDGYDAAVHTFGTIATGGFSNYATSVAAFGSPSTNTSSPACSSSLPPGTNTS
jgi:trk system potassium uptake protein TrkH